MNQQKKVAGKCISVLGTGSDVGKSIVATAICRILKNKGYNISPYKAQNMSNNSAVTEDGGEMGRAQVVQAQASKIEPTVDMNPVLLKPCSDTGSQGVLCGTVIGNKEAGDYFKDTDFLFKEAQKSLLSLRNKYDIVVSALPFANEIAYIANLKRHWYRIDNTLGSEIKNLNISNPAKAERRLKRYQKI